MTASAVIADLFYFFHSTYHHLIFYILPIIYFIYYLIPYSDINPVKGTVLIDSFTVEFQHQGQCLETSCCPKMTA
jgi:hypothetical protein